MAGRGGCGSNTGGRSGRIGDDPGITGVSWHMGTYLWCVPGVCAGGRLARGPPVRGRGAAALWCLHGKATASILCGVPRHAKKETVAVDASIAHERIAGEAAGHEEALFAAARAHAETMIAWAGSEQSLALEHEQLESETMKAGFEFMRLLTQAHLDLRAAREQRRDDVTDADGDARTTCEDGHQRTRVMIYGPVTTSRIAYRKSGKENLYPQDAELNWGRQSYSAGIIRRNAEAVATAPFGPAAAQVSAQGAIHLGKRQSEELAVATAADFGAFYAARRPEPCDPATGLLLTADGSAFPVLPGALRPATAKAAAARAAAAAASGWPDDPGELRRSRKRMAELAAVADIPPAPRTPGDILAALFGTRHGSGSSTRPAPGPKAAGKTMFASVRKPAGEVIAEAFAEAPPRLRSPAAVVRRGGRQQPPDPDHHHARRGLPGQGAHPDRPHSCDGNTCGRPRTASSMPATPKPGPGSRTRRPRSWTASTATCAPGSAAAPPPAATPQLNGPALTNAQTTSSTSRITWTTRLPRRRMARGQRSHRGCGTLDRQGQNGSHRRQMGPGRRRSRPQAPRPARHRRPRRLPRLPLPAGKTPQPRQPLPAGPGTRRMTARNITR